jgi:hypothetical protein
MSKRTHIALIAIGLLAASGNVVQAAALPQTHTLGGIEYMSGGVGKDESTAIEHAGKQWPLTLEFAMKEERRAEFTADVDVLVRDAKGRSILHATADGPFMLVKLAPGRYSVDATLGSKTLHRRVAVTSTHPARVEFLWPSGTQG